MDNTNLLQKYGKTLSPGQVIFNENEDGDLMYIIQDGQVQISRKIAGAETAIATLDKGDFFGEMAIINRIKRTATATAVVQTVLLAFDRVGLEQMVEKNPKIALNIIDKLCRRLQSSNSQVQQLAQKSQRRLILTGILAHSDEGLGAETELVDELAFSLAVARDEVVAVVADLVQSGKLQHEGELLRITDREAFRKFSEKA